QYHTPGDTPANLSPASVQNHGANALALTRALGGEDLAPIDIVASGAYARGDLTYFRVLGLLVTYPDGWSVPVALLAVLVVVALLRRRPGSVALMAGALLVLAALSLFLAVVAQSSGFLLAWPVVGLGLGTAVVLLAGDRPVVAVIGLVLGAVPAVALLVPFAV